MDAQAANITRLLAGWREGDRATLDRLVPLIQRDLHHIARRHLARERKDHTMQPSSPVQQRLAHLDFARAWLRRESKQGASNHGPLAAH